MASATAKSKYQLPPGPFRRVFRQGEDFFCGICREAYDEEIEAKSCMHRCWEEFLASDPVMRFARAGHIIYRCRFCCRTHRADHLARACADDCKDRYTWLFELATQVDQAGALPPPPKRSFKPRMAMLPQPMKPAPRPAKVAEPVVEATVPVDTNPVNADVKAAIDVSTASPAAPTAPVAAEASKDEEADGPGGKKKKQPAGAFYRDNAKYACSSCNKRYFTREEVITCFESHTA